MSAGMQQEPAADTIRPLYDVWLRPRRVFRELATQPVGITDYLLGAAQGVVSWFALSRAQGVGASSGIWEILAKAFSLGALAGISSLWVMAALYAWLGRRMGGTSNRSQVVHVLAYGGVPIVVSLAIWLLACLLLGEAAFVDKPGAETDAFVALLMHVQFFAHAVLLGWSFLLQVMGFSEVERLTTRRAFGTWLIGQLIAAVAMLMLMVLIVNMGASLPQS